MFVSLVHLLAVSFISWVFSFLQFFVYFGYEPLVWLVTAKMVSQSVDFLFLLLVDPFAGWKLLRFILSLLSLGFVEGISYTPTPYYTRD